MSGIDGGGGGQGEYVVAQARYQLPVVSAGKVGAPDAAPEEAVAGKDDGLPAVQEIAAPTRGVSRSGNGLDPHFLAQGDGVAIVERRGWGGYRKLQVRAEHFLYLSAALLVEWGIGFLHFRLKAVGIEHPLCPENMVEVAMGEQCADGVQRFLENVLPDGLALVPCQCAAVDDGRLPAAVAQDVGVFPERIVGEGFDGNHDMLTYATFFVS